MLRLEGKVALVTGASKGIGRSALGKDPGGAIPSLRRDRGRLTTTHSKSTVLLWF